MRFQRIISLFIIFSNLFLFTLILIYYALSGFTPEEAEDLFKLIIPIKSIYMTAAVAFILSTKNENPDGQDRLTREYRLTVRIFIFGHMLLLLALVTAKAFSFIGYGDMKLGFIIAETLFGVYIGTILNSLFKNGTT